MVFFFFSTYTNFCLSRKKFNKNKKKGEKEENERYMRDG